MKLRTRRICLWLLSVAAVLMTPQAARSQFCVNINTAPQEDLEALVHVGPERAGQIVELREARSFRSVDELTRVSGIGAARLADIRAQGLACVTSVPVRRERVATQPSVSSDPEAICVLQRIVDGDTFDCSDSRTIRLLLIDTPEMDQRPFGSIARQTLESLAPIGTRLLLEFDVQRLDPYQRVLAYVRLPDGRLLNEELLRLGVASVVVYPPNVHLVDRFRPVAATARERGVGLWAVGGFACPPDDHRAGRC